MKRSERTKAFTLVELLVVIGIIAMLISILLPALNSARAQAKSMACLSNLKQIGLGITMYANGNKGRLPIGWGSYPGSVTATNPGGKYVVAWPSLIKQYISTAKEENLDEKEYGVSVYLSLPQVYRCPSVKELQGRSSIHYSSNPLAMPEVSRTGVGGRKFTTPLTISQIKPQSDIALVWDGVRGQNKGWDSEYVGWAIDGQNLYYGFTNASDVPGYTRLGSTGANNPVTGYTYDPAPKADGTTPYPPMGTLRWREQRDKAANLLFADGHAEARKIGQVMRSNIWPFR